MSGCFTLAALPGGESCGPTVFDTGTASIEIVAADAHDGAVPAGTEIGMSVGDGAYTHTYTTGPGTRAEVFARSPARGNSIAGLPSLAATDIRYDLANGTIGFRAH
jgi:hypothetical protein